MIAAWARDELATVDLGDRRLNTRAASLLSTLGSRPTLSIPAACQGRAEIKAAYGFFDHDRVTFDKILQPHRECTLQRVAQQAVVLLVQDTTEIDLTRPHQPVAGAGLLSDKRRGFFLHQMHAYTPDGTPLGTVWAEPFDRPEVSHDATAAKRQKRKQTPIEAKESLRWLTGLRQAREVAQQVPAVTCVCVADSEADIYEVLAEPRGERPVEWLIRACQDRALDGLKGQQIRSAVAATPVLYTAELKVRGRTALTTVEKRKRLQTRVTRPAQVEVRAKTLLLRPPPRADRELPPVAVNVVVVREPSPPEGEPAVEWVLLTTLPIDTPEQVRTVVECYCIRWRIEVLFRTLKSGCRVEQRRFEDVERVLPCLGLYLIVAWRTLFVCHLGRECPDVDCEAIFEPSEWKAVWVAVQGTDPPAQAPKLMDMVRLVAALGGYIKRRNQEPGAQTMWIGLQRMYDLAWAWDAFGPGAKLGNR